MTESERNAAFPVHIDLGRKEPDMPMPASTDSPAGKKRKPRVYYPTLYIDSIPGLEKLPKEGCILVDFRRKRLSLEENADGEDTAGVTLEIRGLCLPEDMPDEAEGDLEDVLKKAMTFQDPDESEEDDEGEE